HVSAATLRDAMETAFGASDATGTWDWETAYEACEVATVLFLRKYGEALFRKAASPAARLSAIARIVRRLPTPTRRSEDTQALTHVAPPAPLGLAAIAADSVTANGVVLVPSAGTGLMAILAEIVGGRLVLKALADTRAELLSPLFPAVSTTRFDAAEVVEHL